MITEEKILGNIIKHRQDKGYSQDYMATKMGMKQAGYSLLESGSRKINIGALLQIAMILEISIVDLITYPKKYVEENDVSKSERVSVTFEISSDKKEHLLKLVTGENNL